VTQGITVQNIYSMKDTFKKIGSRFSVLGSLFSFFWKNKMWWLIPMVIILAFFGAILILGQSTPLGPFIYSIF